MIWPKPANSFSFVMQKLIIYSYKSDIKWMIVEQIKTDDAEKVVLSRLAPKPVQIRSYQ